MSREAAAGVSVRVVAWVVRVADEDHMEFVFALTREGARRRSEHHGEEEWTEIRAVRAPEFDHFADLGRVPVEALLEHGYSFECDDCDGPVFVEWGGGAVDSRPYCEKCLPKHQGPDTSTEGAGTP